MMPENPIQAIFAYLAQNPIGEKNTLSTTEVAHQLSDLPQRIAFERINADVILSRFRAETATY